MAVLDVNPRFRDVLAGHGLATAEAFLQLPGVIFCGHPDRHVVQVTLGQGPAAVTAFLKKEHRVPRRDRLVNAWAGFGLVSKSRREFVLLRALREAGIGCPEPVAAGEEDTGKAFLLLATIEGGLDLRALLRMQAAGPRQRRILARQLGAAVAAIHQAGFDHPDLYSKHILVSQDPGGERRFHFLDWQRSRRRRHVSWSHRWRDLAALDATLADYLAGPRDRLAFLRAYLRRCQGRGHALTARLGPGAREIRRQAAALLRRRRIRELREPPLPAGMQNLIWLDGETLCLTREFRDALRGQVPAYLVLPECGDGPPDALTRAAVEVAPSRRAVLARRSARRPFRWLWARLSGKRLASPELQQAGTLFRLQRYAVVTPALLAVGERHGHRWRTESLLLTEPPPATVSLMAWLGRGERRRRAEVLRQAGAVLRRMHEAGCYLQGRTPAEITAIFQVRWDGEMPQVVLGSVEGVVRRHRPRRTLALRDLRRTLATLGRPDALRSLLGYLGRRSLTAADRRTAARVLPRRAAL
jgi:tRNA A-37 threonylcarbamoyl transferase component Bud32